MEIGYIKGSKSLGENHILYDLIDVRDRFNDSSEWWIIIHPSNKYKDMYFVLAENLRFYDTEEEMEQNVALMKYDRCARINMTKPEYIECDIPNWILNEEEKAFLVQILNRRRMWSNIIETWDFEMQTHHELFPIPDYMQLP